MTKFPPVKQPRVPLSEGETVVIQADDPKYDRGLGCQTHWERRV